MTDLPATTVGDSASVGSLQSPPSKDAPPHKLSFIELIKAQLNEHSRLYITVLLLLVLDFLITATMLGAIKCLEKLNEYWWPPHGLVLFTSEGFDGYKLPIQVLLDFSHLMNLIVFLYRGFRDCLRTFKP